MLLMQYPKLWVFGKDMDASNGKYGLPLETNMGLWRKAMTCFHCQKMGCKQRAHRCKLRHTPAYLVSFLFKIRYFHCGKKWRGGCEKFFKMAFNPGSGK